MNSAIGRMRFDLLSLVVLLSCVPVSAIGAEKVYYFHNDHLGTPQAMTNESGVVVWKAGYRPFGEAAVDQDPDGDGKAVVNNLRFPGQYFDAETELHYNWHRYYEPETGRYLQADPIGLRGGGNLYVYATANPVVQFDSSGLDVEIAVTRTRYYPSPKTNGSVSPIPFITGHFTATSDRCGLGPVSGRTLERMSTAIIPIDVGAWIREKDPPQVDRVQLEDRNGRKAIQIHTGTTPKHSTGCVLVGKSIEVSPALPYGVFLHDSVLAMREILDLIAQDGGRIRVIVRDGGAGGM